MVRRDAEDCSIGSAPGRQAKAEPPQLLDLPAASDGRVPTRVGSMGTVGRPRRPVGMGRATQRSLFISIGDDRMPQSVCTKHTASQKAAPAIVERARGAGYRDGRRAIARVWTSHRWEIDETSRSMSGRRVGNAVNMNLNAVLSHRAIQLVGGPLGSKVQFHPNDESHGTVVQRHLPTRHAIA